MLEQALQLLRTRQSEDPEKFPLGVSEAVLTKMESRLPHAIPEYWKQVMRVTDGMWAGPSSGAMLEFNTCEQLGPAAQFYMEDLGDTHLVIAGHGSGDLITLNTAQVTPEGDCPVCWAEHDGNADCDWDSIAPFLMWVLSEQDEGEKQAE